MNDRTDSSNNKQDPGPADRASRRRSSVTIVDVARRAGVSFKSVSRVLNREKHVRPEMRDRVQAAIDELGFVPNLGARSLPGRKQYALGLLFDTLKGQYLLEVQHAAMKSCRDAQYHLIVESLAPETVADPGALAQQLHSLQVDGLAILPPLCDNFDVLAELERQDIPYTRIAPTRELERSSAVIVDDDRAVRDMVQHLWGLGHRRIGFIKGNIAHDSAHRRCAAFVAEMDVLAAQGGSYVLEQGDFSFESGIEAAGRLLDAPDRPTSIFASNDEMGAGVIAAAMMRGLALPADLSVSGFDDSPIARCTWPPLTTICQPLGQMASMAMGHLLGDSAEPVLQHIELKLIQRGSTAPPGRG